MAYTEKTFTSGTTLPALDLNHMDANDDYLRNEADFKIILQVGDVLEEAGNDETFRLQINTTPLGSLRSTSTFSETNIDITGFSDGDLHDISFELDGEGYNRTFKFIKTPDMDYLSYWGKMQVGADGVLLETLTVIAHRTTIS